MQDQGGPLGGRQLAECRDDLAADVVSHPCLLGATSLDLSDHQPQVAPLIALEAPQVVDQPMARDRDQPRRLVGAAVEGAVPADRIEERLLGQLLRERWVAAAAAVQVGVDAGRLLLIPASEGGLVGEDRGQIGRAFAHRYRRHRVPRCDTGSLMRD